MTKTSKPKTGTAFTTDGLYARIAQETTHLTSVEKANLKAQCEQTVLVVNELRAINSHMQKLVKFTDLIQKLVKEEFN